MSARLDLRRRLQLSVIGAVGLALVLLIGAFNLVLRDRLSAEANNALFERASAELATLKVAGGRLAVPEVPDAAALDAQTWVLAGSRTIEQPRSDPVTRRAAKVMSTGPRRTRDLASTHTRLLAVPVIEHGRHLGAVIAAVSLRPYESTAQTALIASVLLGLTILVVVAIAARSLISAALRPVSQMTAQAAAWSEAETGGRFGLGPPHDELTNLAATLDSLLDRVATSLRHEQRFSAEVSHELRSPLTNVIAEAQLALRHGESIDEYRAGYERVLASGQQMRRTLDTLLATAQLELQRPHGIGDAVAATRSAASSCQPLADKRGIDLDISDLSTSIRVGVDTEVAERVLVPLIENACRYGRSSVTVGVARTNGAVEFRVEDDGPGVASADRERIFEAGFSGDGSGGRHVGAGLGLPLARRLARAAGGDVLSSDQGPGGRFIARLPTA